MHPVRCWSAWSVGLAVLFFFLGAVGWRVVDNAMQPVVAVIPASSPFAAVHGPWLDATFPPGVLPSYATSAIIELSRADEGQLPEVVILRAGFIGSPAAHRSGERLRVMLPDGANGLPAGVWQYRLQFRGEPGILSVISPDPRETQPVDVVIPQSPL